MLLHNTNASYKRREKEKKEIQVPKRKRGLHSHQMAVLRKRCHNVPKSLNVPPACAEAPNHRGVSGSRSELYLVAGRLADRETSVGQS